MKSRLRTLSRFKHRSSTLVYKPFKNKMPFWNSTFVKFNSSSIQQMSASVQATNVKNKSTCLKTSSSTKVASYRKSKSKWVSKFSRNNFWKTSETNKISLPLRASKADPELKPWLSKKIYTNKKNSIMDCQLAKNKMSLWKTKVTTFCSSS